MMVSKELQRIADVLEYAEINRKKERKENG